MKKASIIAAMAAVVAQMAVIADETALLQGMIDAAAESGGGMVRVEAGVHEVGGLILKSNVTLELPTVHGSFSP